MKRSTLLLLLSFSVFDFLGHVETSGAITSPISWSGDIDPANPTTWTSSTWGYVGKKSDGTLDITDDRDLRSFFSYIGYEATASGAVTVTGAGSTWTNTIGFYVGYFGDGTLAITDGGTVNSLSGLIGDRSGANGLAMVTGSTWTNNGHLYIARYGSGMLTITGGGSVSNDNGYIGYGLGSTGEVTIAGTGSTWTTRDDLFVGDWGNGTLSITRDGLVSVGGKLTIDYNAGDDSVINMASGGVLALAGEADDSLSDFLNLIDGSDAIRYWDGTLGDWADITSATRGTDYALAYVHDSGSDLDGYTLLTVAPIPEPGTILMLLTGASMLLVRRVK